MALGKNVTLLRSLVDPGCFKISRAGGCCRVILSYHKSSLWDRRIFPRLVQISEQPSVVVNGMEGLGVTSPETVLTYCTCKVGKSTCWCAN